MKTIALFLLCLCAFTVEAQHAIQPFHLQNSYRKPNSIFVNDTLSSVKRNRIVSYSLAGGYATAAAYLGGVWYASEGFAPRFTFFDDSREWLQMDKVGHAWGTYQACRWVTDLYRWSGVEKRKAITRGALIGWGAMTSVEILDGFGEGWGASWTDILANSSGMGLVVLNQSLWNENRIQLKNNYLPSAYALNGQYQNLLGSNPVEWILKDYNGQVNWASVRVHSFLPEGNFKRYYPRWLNIAVGYGGEGLIGGYPLANDPLFETKWNDIRAREYRQYYVAIDLDLSNIKTRSGFLNALFGFVSMFRVPLPAIEIDKYGVRALPFR